MHLLDNDSPVARLRRADPPNGFPAPQIPSRISSDGRLPPPTMDHLDALEAQSIYIFREAFARLKKLALLWSLGKDSNVMIWLARKAFFGKMPFPALHVDTGKKFPEMYAFRDRYAAEWGVDLKIDFLFDHGGLDVLGHDPPELVVDVGLWVLGLQGDHEVDAGRVVADVVVGVHELVTPEHAGIDLQGRLVADQHRPVLLSELVAVDPNRIPFVVVGPRFKLALGRVHATDHRFVLEFAALHLLELQARFEPVRHVVVASQLQHRFDHRH